MLSMKEVGFELRNPCPPPNDGTVRRTKKDIEEEKGRWRDARRTVAGTEQWPMLIYSRCDD